MLEREAEVPEWMTCGRTVLCQKYPKKGNAVDNYRPITRVPLMWKLFSGIFTWRNARLSWEIRAATEWSEVKWSKAISLSPWGFSRLIYNALWGTLARLLAMQFTIILESERCSRPDRSARPQHRDYFPMKCSYTTNGGKCTSMLLSFWMNSLWPTSSVPLLRAARCYSYPYRLYDKKVHLGMSSAVSQNTSNLKINSSIAIARELLC